MTKRWIVPAVPRTIRRSKTDFDWAIQQKINKEGRRFRLGGASGFFLPKDWGGGWRKGKRRRRPCSVNDRCRRRLWGRPRKCAGVGGCISPGFGLPTTAAEVETEKEPSHSLMRTSLACLPARDLSPHRGALSKVERWRRFGEEDPSSE